MSLACPECKSKDTIFRSPDDGSFRCWRHRGGCGRELVIVRELTLAEPTPPSDPMESPDVRLWDAYVEHWNNRDAFNSVLDRELARLEGWTDLARAVLDESTPAAARLAFATASPVATILGYVNHEGEFVRGSAGLSEQEARAFDLSLWHRNEDGSVSVTEIARYMDRKRPSRYGWTALSADAAEWHLRNARRKLRAFFGVHDERQAELREELAV